MASKGGLLLALAGLGIGLYALSQGSPAAGSGSSSSGGAGFSDPGGGFPIPPAALPPGNFPVYGGASGSGGGTSAPLSSPSSPSPTSSTVGAAATFKAISAATGGAYTGFKNGRVDLSTANPPTAPDAPGKNYPIGSPAPLGAPNPTGRQVSPSNRLALAAPGYIAPTAAQVAAAALTISPTGRQVSPSMSPTTLLAEQTALAKQAQLTLILSQPHPSLTRRAPAPYVAPSAQQIAAARPLISPTGRRVTVSARPSAVPVTPTPPAPAARAKGRSSGTQF